MENMTQSYDPKQIRRDIFSMILPITIENTLQMTASFVSMAMIGRINAIAIGALGISTIIIHIVWSIFKGLTMGASVFVAQAYGANNMKKLRHVIVQSLLSGFVMAFLIQQTIFWNASNILKIFNPDNELMIKATMYLRTVSWSIPFLAIMLIAAGVLQSMGKAKIPMKIAMIMNTIHIFVGWILIFGELGIPAMGVKGAAVSLIIAQAIAAILGIYTLFNKDGVLGNSRRIDFQFDIKQIKSVYRIGFPTAIESIFWQIAAVIITRIVLSYGQVALAAYQLGLQAESISYMPAMAFGVASTALIGQAIGAKDKKLGQFYLREIIKGCILLTSISVVVLVFFPGVVMRLLTDQRDITSIATKYLVIMGLVQIPQNVTGVLNGALRGAGFARAPMIVAAIGLWCVRVPLALLIAYWFKIDIVWIWVAIGVDLLVRFALSYGIYKTRDIYDTEVVFDNN